MLLIWFSAFPPYESKGFAALIRSNFEGFIHQPDVDTYRWNIFEFSCGAFFEMSELFIRRFIAAFAFTPWRHVIHFGAVRTCNGARDGIIRSEYSFGVSPRFEKNLIRQTSWEFKKKARKVEKSLIAWQTREKGRIFHIYFFSLKYFEFSCKLKIILLNFMFNFNSNMFYIIFYIKLTFLSFQVCFSNTSISKLKIPRYVHILLHITER